VRHSTARSQRHRGEDLDRRPAIARGRANARARMNSEICVLLQLVWLGGVIYITIARRG
jgi:hypothetical protein